MIGSLTGKIDYAGKDFIVINVAGVGYKVFVSSNVYEKVQKAKEEVKLFISTQLRENSLNLCGFLKIEDLKIFEQLLQVSGVGPKTALSVFEAGSSEEIKDAIADNDVSFFTAVSGIGKRSAQRIIVDLKAKITGLEEAELLFKDLKEYEDVILALRSLDYPAREARQTLKEVLKTHKTKALKTEELLKLCLKNLGKQK